MMLSPIIARWAVIAALCAALFCYGFVVGLRHESDRHTDFVAQVARAGAKQQARTDAAVGRQTAITQQSEIKHVQGAAALRDLYGPGRTDRMRQPSHFDGLKLPAVPDPAAEPDAAAADAGPGAAEPAPDADACAGLRSDAAMTTRQLLFLQGWVEQQAASAQ